MLIGFSIWYALAGVVGAVWLVRIVATGQIARKRTVLSSWSYDGPPAPAPRVSIIVAAKDEEANIETCVTGLLAQDYPDFELIVVDDRSGDETPAILKRLQASGDRRLRVLTITELRDGWFGKNNAMRAGVEAAAADWLLFTDADCRFRSPRTVSMAMREATAHESDFLSVTPVLETHAAWEKVIQPVCALVLMIWFLPHRVNKRKRKAAYANGAFMLMNRRCYRGIGGHERVKTEVNEDIQMARFAKGQGFALRVVENEDLYTTRMYDDPRTAWRGWSRIFYGSLGTVSKLAVSVFLMTFFSILPWASVVVAAVGWGWAQSATVASWMAALLVWAGVVVIEQFVIWRVYVLMRAAPVWSLTYISGCVVVVGMLFSAMLKVVGAGRTTWRGTTYRLNRLEGQPGPLPSQKSITRSGAVTTITPPGDTVEEPSAHA